MCMSQETSGLACEHWACLCYSRVIHRYISPGGCLLCSAVLGKCDSGVWKQYSPTNLAVALNLRWLAQGKVLGNEDARK